jgi:hypothetical protein
VSGATARRNTQRKRAENCAAPLAVVSSGKLEGAMIMRNWFLLVLSLVLCPNVASSQEMPILRCQLEGKQFGMERELSPVIVPPSDDEAKSLWTLNRDDTPHQLLKLRSWVGEIQVRGERHDLLILQKGPLDGGNPLVAVWWLDAMYPHPSQIVVKLWDEDMPATMIESDQTVWTGNCTPA